MSSNAIDSRPPSHAGPRPASQASQAVKSLLPLRADVLLSNSLFEDLADGICENFLQYYTGATDLTTVRSLEIQVDTVQENQQVEALGDLLPNLDQLRLSQSAILTMRDLGTGLTNLRVLYLSRCSLQDLGGVTALPVLEELYVSFNDICDLSPLCTHESLQVLDLEGNLVEDCSDVEEALQTVSTLRELTLVDNPVMKGDEVRAKLLSALPQLEVLDDIPRVASTRHAPVDEDDEEDEAVEEYSEVEESEDECSDVEELVDNPVVRAPQFEVLDEIPRPTSSKHERALSIQGFSEAIEATSMVAEAYGVEAWQVRYPEAASLQTKEMQDNFEAEPTDQELVVESLRRGRRDLQTATTVAGNGRTTSCGFRPVTNGFRPATGGFRPATCFAPDRRPLRSSAGSGSLRPTTASSGISTGISGQSTAFEDGESCASDLTTGGDGSPLVGNPLAAIRRRRHCERHAPAENREDDIRNLLRKFEVATRELSS